MVKVECKQKVCSVVCSFSASFSVNFKCIKVNGSDCYCVLIDMFMLSKRVIGFYSVITSML